MEHVFEVINKAGRKIHLSKRQWTHITTRHPFMTNHLEKIKETLQKPVTIISHEQGELFDYYGYYKHEKLKYLKVVVKYINNTGYV